MITMGIYNRLMSKYIVTEAAYDKFVKLIGLLFVGTCSV